MLNEYIISFIFHKMNIKLEDQFLADFSKIMLDEYIHFKYIKLIEY